MTRLYEFYKPETTLDLPLNRAQELALEHAIKAIFKHNAHGPEYVMRKLDIEYNGRTISMIMEVDNNKPGTLGHTFPSHAHLFIGPRGGYHCYVKGGKKVSGWKALIYCNRS